MQNNKIKDVTIHPLMIAREHSHENKVEFQGFIRPTDRNFIRLYTDLQGLSHVEIPEEAILYWKKGPATKTRKISIFVSASKQVTEVHRRFVMAHSSTLSLYGPSITIDEDRQNTRFPESISFWSYIENWGYAFAANAAQIIRLNTQISNETNRQRRQFLIMRVEIRKSRAKSALRFCLSNCPKTGALISLEDVYSGICKKHLGVANCTEPWDG